MGLRLKVRVRWTEVASELRRLGLVWWRVLEHGSRPFTGKVILYCKLCGWCKVYRGIFTSDILLITYHHYLRHHRKLLLELQHKLKVRKLRKMTRQRTIT